MQIKRKRNPAQKFCFYHRWPSRLPYSAFGDFSSITLVERKEYPAGRQVPGAKEKIRGKEDFKRPRRQVNSLQLYTLSIMSRSSALSDCHVSISYVEVVSMTP